MESSDLTCLQVFNALSWAMQAKRFERDLPFNVFIEEYIRERRKEDPGAAGQQVGDREAARA
jgi:hypothetical protein